MTRGTNCANMKLVACDAHATIGMIVPTRLALAEV